MTNFVLLSGIFKITHIDQKGALQLGVKLNAGDRDWCADCIHVTNAACSKTALFMIIGELDHSQLLHPSIHLFSAAYPGLCFRGSLRRKEAQMSPLPCHIPNPSSTLVPSQSDMPEIPLQGSI